MALVVAEPGALPVSIEELKGLLRIENSAEDAMLAGLLRSASETCEAFVGQALVAQLVVETLAAAPRWSRLAVAPVRAIETVATVTEDGSAIEMAADGYATDIDADGQGWVRVTQPPSRGLVRLRYVAGMAADPNGVPEPLRQGILRLAAHSYSARGEVEAPPPASVAALWRPWRRTRLR